MKLSTMFIFISLLLVTATVLAIVHRSGQSWEDYALDHNCHPEVPWPQQPEYGLVIQASPTPVWWQCDTGRFFR